MRYTALSLQENECWRHHIYWLIIEVNSKIQHNQGWNNSQRNPFQTDANARYKQGVEFSERLSKQTQIDSKDMEI
jgi:hypothetical protein